MSAPTSGSADGSPTHGYYPDPSIPGYIRYWNGVSWVPGTSRPAPVDGEDMPGPPPGSAPAAPAPEETRPVFFDEEPARAESPSVDTGSEPGPGGQGTPLPELRPRGEVDVRPDSVDWDDPQRLHGSRPEPASAWQADASRQTGFGGDQDHRVSWGADPAAASDPSGTTGAGTPASGTAGTPASGTAGPSGSGSGGAASADSSFDQRSARTDGGGRGSAAGDAGTADSAGSGSAGPGIATGRTPDTSGSGSGSAAAAGDGQEAADSRPSPRSADGGRPAAGDRGRRDGTMTIRRAGRGGDSGSAAQADGTMAIRPIRSAGEGGAGTAGASAVPAARDGDDSAAGREGAAGAAARHDGTMTIRATGGVTSGGSGPRSASGPASGPGSTAASGSGSGSDFGSRSGPGGAEPADGTMAIRVTRPGAGQAPASAPGGTDGGIPPQPGPASRAQAPGSGQNPHAAPQAGPVQQPHAPAPTPAQPPAAQGSGGGQPSWAQQVHQLADPGPAGTRQGSPDAPVTPWRPPVADPFLAAAQAQAAVRPASLGRRLAARLIDTVLLGAVVAGAAVPFGTKAVDHVNDKVEEAKLSGETVTVWLLDGTTSGYLGIVVGVLLLAGVLYEALPTAKWGRTLGKRLCGVQVLGIESHDTPPFGAALRRWLVYSVLGLLAIGVLNVLWCLFDRPWRQCWHDKAAGTFVGGTGGDD
ncbi:RDD family protein [Streptomyces sp. NPDC004647]|uniref:RDD family protein n=1 Tax=Streptomyces sp. NPDC004647 TaxID=3154671 RepID=UPI0033AD6EF0